MTNLIGRKVTVLISQLLAPYSTMGFKGAKGISGTVSEVNEQFLVLDNKYFIHRQSITLIEAE